MLNEFVELLRVLILELFSFVWILGDECFFEKISLVDRGDFIYVLIIFGEANLLAFIDILLGDYTT